MRALFLILIMVFGCVACQPAEPTVVPTVTDSPPTKVVQLPDIRLSYQPAVLQTEVPLELTIDTPADWILLKAELVGLSMDMLTMPLFFRQQSISGNAQAIQNSQASQAVMLPGAQTQWHTQFLLGACADPQMRWRLQLQFRDGKGQLLQRQDEFIVNRR